jgi:peptidoglycan/LPS O-acetylase OafA/YrhL
VAADDALRAQSVRAMAGAALSLLLLLCCGAALGLQASDVDALHTLMIAPAVLFLLASLVACGEVGGSRWRVRRPARTGAAVSA